MSATTNQMRAVLEQNEVVLNIFLRHCINDVGMRLQLLGVLQEQAASLFGGTGCEPNRESLSGDFSTARGDFQKGMGESGGNIIQATILAAPSVDYLVRKFKVLSTERPHVMPEHYIPSDEVVEAALVLFYENRMEQDR